MCFNTCDLCFPVIDRSSNDQHHCVIDVLSLFLLLMLSLDGATGLLETLCVCEHVFNACVCVSAQGYICPSYLYLIGLACVSQNIQVCACVCVCMCLLVCVCLCGCVWISRRCECGC